MKIVSLIPYWEKYGGNVGGVPRNLVKVGGRYLLNYSVETLGGVSEVDNTIIYTSTLDIEQFMDSGLNCEIQKRPSVLDSDGVSIEDIIKQFLKDNDVDVIVLLHPNSPFLKSETISDCVKKVVSGEFDSAFTGYEYHKIAWYKGKPLNYSSGQKTPSINKIEPIVFEQSSLYVFTRSMFDELNSRIGSKPYVKIIDHFEGHDVNYKEDLDVAELIVNSGMYSKI